MQGLKISDELSKLIEEGSVTREWTVKPGKRLYVEFICRSKVLFKGFILSFIELLGTNGTINLTVI